MDRISEHGVRAPSSATPTSISDSTRSRRARTASTISSSVARALSELVLIPVRVARIAWACFRQLDGLLGGVAHRGGVDGQIALPGHRAHGRAASL